MHLRIDYSLANISWAQLGLVPDCEFTHMSHNSGTSRLLKSMAKVKGIKPNLARTFQVPNHMTSVNILMAIVRHMQSSEPVRWRNVLRL